MEEATSKLFLRASDKEFSAIPEKSNVTRKNNIQKDILKSRLRLNEVYTYLLFRIISFLTSFLELV